MPGHVSLPLLLVVLAAPSLSAQAPVGAPSLAEPAISPDGAEIAFVSGGDVWTVPSGGGEGRLLVSDPATESRPLYSPDGGRVAFVSTRTGNGDVYVLTLATGEVRRLTHSDALDQLDGWSRDGRWLYFSATSDEISGMNDVFRVSAAGGTPMPVTSERYTNEFEAAESPDGTAVAFAARGIASSQWWRKGSSHLDESELWLVRPGAAPRWERLTAGGAKQQWPMWGADGRTLYFVSDRGGAQNVWRRDADGSVRPVTRFTTGRVLWPAISADGRTIVFERDFGVWRLDPATGEARALSITLRGAPQTPAPEHRVLTDDLQELALSPDGKKLAFAVHGEVFAAGAKEGGDAVRLTGTPAREWGVRWMPDSRRVVYASERDGGSRLYLYDLASREETPLTAGRGTEGPAEVAPDGKAVAFVRDGRELMVVDPATKRERRLATGYFGLPPFTSDRSIAWSPDGRWVAYLSPGPLVFNTAYVVPADGSAPARQVSFVANVFAGGLTWSPDGTYLLLGTSQRTEETQVVRVDLVPRLPEFREDQFRDLFKEQTPRTVVTPEQRTSTRPEAPEPERAAPVATPETGADSAAAPPERVEVDFHDIRRRASPLPIGLDVDGLSLSPDGKWLLVTARTANQQNLYVYPMDELAPEPVVARQITSTPGSKVDAQFSPDSKEVWYLEAGKVRAVALEGGKEPRSVAVRAELDEDFKRQKEAVFEQAWRYLRDNFADPEMNGADWSAVHETYGRQVAGARTPDEMRRLLQLMVGELNASHSGVSGPPGGNRPTVGRLGLRFDPADYERSGRLKVTEVLSLGPAALAGIRPGETLLAVDGTPIDARTNLDALLENRIGRRVALTVGDGSGAHPREVVAKPVNQATEKGLAYRDWVERQRAYVERISHGRLGYVHMYDMSSGALAQLYLDLDVENHAKEGVVIDVRNNNGGFVNAYALDVFARRPYLTLTRRGQVEGPARTVLGQRALERPTVLVTNRHSLSDAEDFTEGYRTLGLGKVVGEPTAGWIIYTSNVPLVDGTVVRIPFIQVRDHDGQVMEMHPRPVDVAVDRRIGEGHAGRDSQLEAAVAELLSRLPERPDGVTR
jgi:Tol biopolymer transport system component/C-terminal processing protease CtpA/Prc